MQVVEVVFFKNFKEKLQLMKNYEKIPKNNIEIFKNYIMVELSSHSRG